MNNQLIEKIITSNDEPCPEFTFDNPLLDKNVAKALSKSFVKILNAAEPNSKVNNNLRLSILENLRKMCQAEPQNHMKIDENVTSMLVEAYEQKDSSSANNDGTGKVLDEFLVRNMKDMDINSSHNASISPEVLQALINLNENRGNLNTLYKDIIHWDSMDKKNIHILKDLWLNTNYMVDDVSLKLKSEIEKIFLEICHNLLNNPDSDIAELFVSNADLKNLVSKCSLSPSCFQMSSSVLNYIFIMTNFTNCMQTFIKTFVEHVKEVCTHLTISILYPIHLSHIVVLLDIDIENLPISIKNKYAQEAIKHMHALKSESETDFLMLLCHFPQWFDIIPQ